MSNVTPQMVQSLREKTGAGMGDCKKALDESNGDMDIAVEYLRKKGAASAAKRAEREAKEGAIVARTSGKKAILVEVNSETDFVAKNEGFVDYTKNVGEAMITSDVNSVEELMNVNVAGNTLINLHNDVLAKFSEKIEIRRLKRINSTGYVESYVHLGGKLAVLLEVSVTSDKLNDNCKTLIRDITMQIAAMNPLHLDKSVVSQAILDKEKEIETEKAIAEGKKPEIAQKIAEGKINKYFEEFCLMQQIFVKDNKKVVADVVAEIIKESVPDFKLLSFYR
jgi:elongation factor Ts